MKISNILSINTKKLKTKPKKAMFLIIPVVVLITLSIIVSSQIQNIKDALSSSVFETISNQYTLLTVQTEEESFNPSAMFNNQSSFEQNKFSSTDVTNIQSIEGVKSTSLQTAIPIQNILTSDLFTEKTVKLPNLSTLDESTASLYTEENFTYTEGEAIPIILSANSFNTTYEDWSEGTTRVIEMGTPQAPGEGRGMNRVTIEKTEAIEYVKDDLIGKTFTISFGGLDDIVDYTISMDRETRTQTITKLTDAEFNTKLEERETAISKYWDYSKISTPVTYTFVVVGIDESESSTTNYIPELFADTLMSTYIRNEINARVVDEIPTDVLNADFLGITYNGDELSSGGFGGIMSQIGGRFEQRMVQPGVNPAERDEVSAEEISFSAITIPGLVINIDSDDDSVVGTLDNPDIYSSATKYADSMNIVLSSITYRTEVIKALNKAGYAYQDLGDLDVFENLESTLETVSNIFLISFIVLVASIVVLTMGKLVSESTKEIGIFRAIGMRKKDVLLMFISQSLLYVIIGYAAGLIFGIGLNLITSGLVSSWFDSFINETVSQTFNVINTVDESVFTRINWTSVGIYSVLLFLISLIVSIIPSMSASKISPVEAIKNE
ncbi:MAG: ABC transporter permease [Candidatus Dojkabacteria bacterium]